MSKYVVIACEGDNTKKFGEFSKVSEAIASLEQDFRHYYTYALVCEIDENNKCVGIYHVWAEGMLINMMNVKEVARDWEYVDERAVIKSYGYGL